MTQTKIAVKIKPGTCDCPSHCGIGQKYMPVVGDSVAQQTSGGRENSRGKLGDSGCLISPRQISDLTLFYSPYFCHSLKTQTAG